MRIITKIHDYYDSAMALGVDTKRIFVRNEVPPFYLKHCKNQNRYEERSSSNSCGFTMEFILVGFCGIMYPCIKYHAYEPRVPRTYNYIYTVQELTTEIAKIKKHSSNDLLDIEFAKCWLGKSVYKSSWYPPLDNAQYISKFIPMFVKHKTPYFVITYKWRSDPVCNLMPLLKNYKFYKVKDSYTAYQDIDMFLHNQLCDMDNPPIDPIPDVLKAQSKGFNKFSFRKDKQK
jgi:hypothetical protein